MPRPVRSFVCSKWILKAWKCRSSCTIQRTNLTFPPGTRVYRPSDCRGICHVAFHISLVFFFFFSYLRTQLEVLLVSNSSTILIHTVFISAITHHCELLTLAKLRCCNRIGFNHELHYYSLLWTDHSFVATKLQWALYQNSESMEWSSHISTTSLSRYREFSWLLRSP